MACFICVYFVNRKKLNWHGYRASSKLLLSTLGIMWENNSSVWSHCNHVQYQRDLLQLYKIHPMLANLSAVVYLFETQGRTPIIICVIVKNEVGKLILYVKHNRCDKQSVFTLNGRHNPRKIGHTF